MDGEEAETNGNGRRGRRLGGEVEGTALLKRERVEFSTSRLHLPPNSQTSHYAICRRVTRPTPPTNDPNSANCPLINLIIGQLGQNLS